MKPLDISLEMELAPERKAAIAAVGRFITNDELPEFWDSVSRVEKVCREYNVCPDQAAWALNVISPYISPDGEYGALAVFDGQLNGLIAAVAHHR